MQHARTVLLILHPVAVVGIARVERVLALAVLLVAEPLPAVRAAISDADLAVPLVRIRVEPLVHVRTFTLHRTALPLTIV